MNQSEIGRREFLKGTIQSAALAGLTSTVMGSEISHSEAASALAAVQARQAAKPVVISSSNTWKAANGTTLKGGINATTRAMEILKAGGDTLDAVIAGVNLVEDDPWDDSVGYGGLPNEEGEVELDSSVMHGPTRRCGAVAALKYIKNPSKVAKLVMDRTDHVMLVGEGALRFALQHGFKKEDLLTEHSRQAWLKWKEELNQKDNWGPSWHHTAPAGKKVSQKSLSREEIALNDYIEDRLLHRPTGTISCLALDANGDLSGVTTTSGLAWKIPGRVGDSPLIGCGLYVDNEIGAAGSTGRGEECIFINGAHTIVENMRHGLSPVEAALDAVKRVSARYGNNLEELSNIQINFYALNKRGEYGAASLWKGSTFAVHDGTQARLIDTVYLYEKKA